MRYIVVGAIVVVWLGYILRVVPSNDPEVQYTIGAPWWLLPLAPAFIFVVMVVRRLLKGK